ncbi:MAG TPA: inner membrane CreD family protein [Chthoniobacterales bacterium]
MKSQTLTFVRILAIGFILAGAGFAWFVLGGSLQLRTMHSDSELASQVADGWGPPLQQSQPAFWIASPSANGGKKLIQPESTHIRVRLESDPLKKGLLWYRGYRVRFEGEYQIVNPTPIAQTLYADFLFPSEKNTYFDVEFEFGDQKTGNLDASRGLISGAVNVPANGTVRLRVAYRSRGLNRWDYVLNDSARVRGFNLRMETDFAEINFPEGTGSPTSRSVAPDQGWVLNWSYPDVIGARPIGMDMPKVLNAGPVAARISFFAPVSLVFFFAVLLILGSVRNINLHPMNYFFLAAGCFAFQLLFAYLVDVLPIHLSFVLSALVSMVLVSGYLHAMGGRALSSISIPAQFAYMVLFSYSFFFDGFSGLTITLGAVATLAILMIATAKVDWSEKFSRKPPVPIPAEA